MERLITPEGYAKLEEELQQLWKTERPRVVQEVAEAAAHGDRSENAEYKYGKRRLREIDRRVRYLSKTMESLRVVEPAQHPKDHVAFGAWMTIEDEEGRIRNLRIVGDDEVDAKRGFISRGSPLGRALWGCELGESRVVKRPAGELEVTLTELRYTP